MTDRRAARPVSASVRIVLGVAMSAAVGCAKIEAPTGGPVDDTPPRLAGSSPDSGAVGVGSLDTLALLFSEPMDKESVERGFMLSPAVSILSREWEGLRWRLRLERPLELETTYVLALPAAVEDRRKNKLGRWTRVVFSTGASIDDGRIAGSVEGRRYPGKQAWIFLWPFDAPFPDSTTEHTLPDPLRITQADDKGIFTLEAVPRGISLRLCALHDRNQDRRFDPFQDRYGCVEDAITLPDSGEGLGDVALLLAELDEPGTVSVEVADSLCDAVLRERPWARARAEGDSLRALLAGSGGDARRDTSLLDQLARAEALEASAAGATESERIAPTPSDSLAWGVRLLELDAALEASRTDSTECALPIVVELLGEAGEIVRTATGRQVSWPDVPPGRYGVRVFRDRNRSGAPDDGEERAEFPVPIEVLPVRTVDGIRLRLDPLEITP